MIELVEKPVMGKWGSRKFYINVAAVGLLSGLPIIYAQFQVVTEVQMLVLGCIASTCLGYSVTNIFDKKFNGQDQ